MEVSGRGLEEADGIGTSKCVAKARSLRIKGAGDRFGSVLNLTSVP